LLSFQVFGALLLEEKFEGSTALGSRTGINLARTGCFSKSKGDSFNSVELSTRRARTGTQSVRFETPGNKKCYAEQKSRNEIIYGEGITGLTTGPSGTTGIGSEFWQGFSIYFATDEGSSGWWNASQNLYIAQNFSFRLGTTSASPEQHFIKKPGSTVAIRTTYSTDPSKEVAVENPTINASFKQNEWNDVVIHFKRAWDSSGIYKVWVNGALVVNFTGPTAIRNHDSMRFKAGMYFGETIVNHTWVTYYDNMRIGNASSSYAEVDPSKDSVGGDGPGPVESDAPVFVSVNGGAALVPGATDVPFVANNAVATIGCKIKASGITTAETFVNWSDTGGLFDMPALTGITSSSGILECYQEPIDTVVDVYTDSANATKTIGAVSSAAGYTTGMTITKKTTGDRTTVNQTNNRIGYTTGDKIALTVDYKVPSGKQMYIGLSDVIGTDRRLELVGLGGSLALQTLNGGYGTAVSLTQRVLPDGVHRAILRWTVNSTAPSYKLRLGQWQGNVNDTIVVYKAWLQRNAKTTVYQTEVPIALSITDTTPPTISDCTMTNKPNMEVGGYQVRSDCTTNEIGGRYYGMITTTNTNPTAAQVIAGTGSIWARSYPVYQYPLDFTANGMEYRDLWMWTVHQDAAGNNSAVNMMTFDVPAGTKKIKFGTPAVGRLKVGSAFYTGSFNALKVFSVFPWISETAPLIVIDDPAFVSGMATFVEADATTGSINSLVPATNYYFVAYDTDGNPFSAGEFQITVE